MSMVSFRITSYDNPNHTIKTYQNKIHTTLNDNDIFLCVLNNPSLKLFDHKIHFRIFFLNTHTLVHVEINFRKE